MGELVIVAKTGWTTKELIDAIESSQISGRFDIVSLLAGVNDQYRGFGIGEYRKQFNRLLDSAVWFAGNDSEKVIVLSIPDWGVTPFAEGKDRALISEEIDRFNRVNREETFKRKISYCKSYIWIISG